LLWGLITPPEDCVDLIVSHRIIPSWRTDDLGADHVVEHNRGECGELRLQGRRILRGGSEASATDENVVGDMAQVVQAGVVADRALDFDGRRPGARHPAVPEIVDNVGDVVRLPVAETDVVGVQKRRRLGAVTEQTGRSLPASISHGSEMTTVIGHRHVEDACRSTEIRSNTKTFGII
jgi:hypothetical protein